MSTIATLPKAVLDKLGLLPLELRHMDGTLAKHTVLRALVQDPGLEPGEYLVIAEPFVGTNLSQPVVVREDGELDLTALAVSLVPQVVAAGTWLFAAGMLVARTWRQFSGAFDIKRANRELRVFKGVPLGTEPLTEAPPSSISLTREGEETLVKPDGVARVIVQLPGSRDDEAPLNVMLLAGTSLLLRTAHGKSLRVSRIEYGHPIVDQLVTLRNGARLSAINAVLTELSSEEAKGVVASSPAAALRLAYALVAAGNGPIGEMVIRELDNTWSDTHVIRAERLAWEERYSEAFEAALTATQLGLPACSVGLDFLTRRLSTYAMIARSKEPRAPEKRAVSALARKRSDEINIALDVLQPFAAACDFECGLTAWRSYDPAMTAETAPFKPDESADNNSHPVP